MENRNFLTRTIAVIVCLVLLLGGFTYSLYQFQIVHGAEALAQAGRKIASSDTVEAARGEITDRYGRVLVTNRLCYNLSLDTAVMGEIALRNKQILDLVNLCVQKEVPYADSLPLSPSAPFSLTGDTQKKTFQNYLADRKLDPGLTGPQLLAALRTEYKIDASYSEADARKIAGVRYELDLRTRNLTTSPYVFAQDVDIAFITILKERDFSGVKINTTTARDYKTPYAAQLLGWIGQMSPDEWKTLKGKGYSMADMVGKDGVEKTFESYLHGSGTVQISDAVTARDTAAADEANSLLAKPGSNIALTLDLGLQESLETALDTYMSKKNAKHGAGAVILDVSDGGVLAMASYPTYDLSTFASSYSELASQALSPLLNRATRGVYPPGSTFKMVMAVGGLQEGIIDTKTKILDTGRYTFYKDSQPMCWYYREYHKTHGYVDVTKALEVSCNVFFYDVGRRLTIQKIDEYAAKFGLGQATGIELPEARGVLAGPENSQKRGQTWYEGNVLSAAIGQSDNSFTPLQLASYVATLAGGGTRYSVHVLDSVKSYDYSTEIVKYQPKVLNSIEISPENLAAVKAGMLAVTQSGTAAPYFKGLSVMAGAKTGSAQVGGNSDSNAVFVCFAPYDNPKIAMAFVAEKGGAGYELAQVARSVLEYYFSSADASAQTDAENAILP